MLLADATSGTGLGAGASTAGAGKVQGGDVLGGEQMRGGLRKEGSGKDPLTRSWEDRGEGRGSHGGCLLEELGVGEGREGDRGKD